MGMQDRGFSLLFSQCNEVRHTFRFQRNISQGGEIGFISGICVRCIKVLGGVRWCFNRLVVFRFDMLSSPPHLDV